MQTKTLTILSITWVFIGGINLLLIPDRGVEGMLCLVISTLYLLTAEVIDAKHNKS